MARLSTVCSKYPATYLMSVIYCYWEYLEFLISRLPVFFAALYNVRRLLHGVCNNMNSAYISLSVNLIYWLLRRNRVCNFLENSWILWFYIIIIAHISIRIFICKDLYNVCKVLQLNNLLCLQKWPIDFITKIYFQKLEKQS